MQEKEHLTSSSEVGDHISLKGLILGLREWFLYFISKWYLIITFIIVGGVFGLWYASQKKVVYSASTTFVLESGNARGGLGQYAGVASMIGIDLGSDGGLFQGENIIELYKSRFMITNALLSDGVFQGQSQKLIDRFINSHNIRRQWQDNATLKNIQFSGSNVYDSKQQILHDSIIGEIVSVIRANHLVVGKPDKKLNLIKITVNSVDELFAQAFNVALVNQVNNFYLDTKTKRSLQNVNILQAKTDSVRNIMTGSINHAAAVADATPNQNPTRMAQRMGPIQNATVNAEVSQEVLASLLQNLEMSKISLLKETPLIQIVDTPIRPLDKITTSRLKALIVGAFIGGLLTIMAIGARKIVMNALKY